MDAAVAHVEDEAVDGLAAVQNAVLKVQDLARLRPVRHEGQRSYDELVVGAGAVQLALIVVADRLAHAAALKVEHVISDWDVVAHGAARHDVAAGTKDSALAIQEAVAISELRIWHTGFVLCEDAVPHAHLVAASQARVVVFGALEAAMQQLLLAIRRPRALEPAASLMMDMHAMTEAAVVAGIHDQLATDEAAHDAVEHVHLIRVLLRLLAVLVVQALHAVLGAHDVVDLRLLVSVS